MKKIIKFIRMLLCRHNYKGTIIWSIDEKIFKRIVCSKCGSDKVNEKAK